MEHYHLINQLQRELQNNITDVKAETLLALALENGLTEEDFIVAFDSFFHREYSKDVLFSDLKEDAAKRNFLQLHLTRCGLYDQLPEGLFYQQNDSTHSALSATEMAAEYKMNKRKEQEIRQFFTPFENDFFWQRLQLEKEEMQWLKGFEAGRLNDYFVRFWNIPSAVPAPLIAPLVKLLPYAPSISGHPEVIAQCLEAILQEQVCVTVRSAPVSKAGPDCILPLDSSQLGVNTVLGEEFMENYPVLQFFIGPLQHSHITDYLEGGTRWAFLETFYRFFIPVEMDIHTHIELPAEENNMHLAADRAPVLGYSSVL